MRYYKNVDENGYVSINTLNEDGNGNITKEEYEMLNQMIIEKPDGKCVHDNGDGTYEYEDMPPMPEPELEDTEALSILLGGVGS